MNIRNALLIVIALILLVVIAFLARKSRDTAVVVKVAVGIVGFAALLAGLYIAYDQYWDRPRIAQSLDGVSLGMSEEALSKTLGPAEVATTLDGEGRKVFYYQSGSRRIMARLAPMADDAPVVTTVCSNAGPAATGISKHSDRSTVLERLGRPDAAAGDARGENQWLLFTEWQFAVRLRNQRVALLCATTEQSLDFTRQAERMERALEHPDAGALPF